MKDGPLDNPRGEMAVQAVPVALRSSLRELIRKAYEADLPPHRFTPAPDPRLPPERDDPEPPPSPSLEQRKVEALERIAAALSAPRS